MKFISTRGRAPALGFSDAIQVGLAADGGLYVPERFPALSIDEALPFTEIATRILRPFVEGEPVAGRLEEICRRALNFPIELKILKENTAVLELFHGPTAAFKDFGARFLAESLQSILPRTDTGVRSVLVATSGDTGGAVAAAFHGQPGFEVIILYPKGKISPRQEKQLTTWGGNVLAFAVHGTFDDCQRIAKEAFLDPDWKRSKSWISANSINLGRILPQMTYYAWASLEYRERTGEAPGMIIPTGNLGNALACLWARKIGFPIREVVLACNANRPIVQYLETGHWGAHPTIGTLANAMDVGNPSNMERARHLFPSIEEFKANVQAYSITDEEIRETIRSGVDQWGEVWCPHTATAVATRKRLADPHWVIVSTAHPAKFESIVEPLLNQGPIAVPAPLAEILRKPSYFTEIPAELQALRKAVG